MYGRLQSLWIDQVDAEDACAARHQAAHPERAAGADADRRQSQRHEVVTRRSAEIDHVARRIAAGVRYRKRLARDLRRIRRPCYLQYQELASGVIDRHRE